MVYGRGLLDLTRAFQPVGTTATPTSTGASVVAEASPGSFVGAAFGDAFGRQSALTTVAYDAYDRLFQVQQVKNHGMRLRAGSHARSVSNEIALFGLMTFTAPTESNGARWHGCLF